MRTKTAFLLLALALLALALPANAEVGCASCNGISVTSTSATTTFSTYKSSVCLINDGNSANEVYARIFTTADTAAAAVAGATARIRLEPGDGQCWSWNSKEGGLGYSAVSYITANTETATLRVVPK